MVYKKFGKLKQLIFYQNDCLFFYFDKNENKKPRLIAETGFIIS
jgi:hypothetical protein